MNTIARTDCFMSVLVKFSRCGTKLNFRGFVGVRTLRVSGTLYCIRFLQKVYSTIKVEVMQLSRQKYFKSLNIGQRKR
jgi:hypothetical protein